MLAPASSIVWPFIAPILLLSISNIFMTFAWYGQLKYPTTSLWLVIPISWGIAFLEYCFAVPANRFGYLEFSGFQLKIIQEAVTVTVFVVFAIAFLKERLTWNYLVSFLLLIGAVFFAFAIKPGTATT